MPVDLNFSLNPLTSPIIIVIFIIMALLSLSFYRKIAHKIERRKVFILLTVRILTLIMIFILIFNIEISFLKKTHKKPTVALLIDTSLSMKLPSNDGVKSRIKEALEILGEAKKGFLNELKKDFYVLEYQFGTELSKMSSDSLKSENEINLSDGTHLIKAIQRMSDFKVQNDNPSPLEAIIILTDGNSTEPNIEIELEKQSDRIFSLPIFPVGFGKEEKKEIGDNTLKIASIDSPEQSYIGDQVEVKIILQQKGLNGDKVTLEIKENESKNLVASKTEALSEFQSEFTLSFKPQKTGFFQYGASVLTEKNKGEAKNPLSSGEKVMVMDQGAFSLEVLNKKIRLLYYEGKPRWEYKFLKQTLESDSTIEPTFVVKLYGDKFYIQGIQPEGLVLIKNGILSADCIHQFDCVILGDLKEDDLSAGVLAALKTYVVDKGKGIIIVPGLDSFGLGGFLRGGTQELLPIKIEDSAKFSIGKFKILPDLVSQGHPIISNLKTFFEEGLLLDGLFEIGEIKSGAEVILRESGGKGVLVTQIAGAGRTLFWSSDVDWKWRRQGEKGREVFSRLWGQMVRWGAGLKESDSSVENDSYLTLSKRRLKAGEKIQFLGSKKIDPQLKIIAENGEESVLVLGEIDGQMRGEFSPKIGGEYVVKVKKIVEGENKKDGKDIKEFEERFIVESSEGELNSKGQNTSLLKAIASRSGGKYYFPADIQKISGEIIKKSKVAFEKVNFALSNSPFIFLIILLLLTLEWILRRRVGII